MSEVWTREPAPTTGWYWKMRVSDDPVASYMSEGQEVQTLFVRSTVPIPSAEEADRGRRAIEMLRKLEWCYDRQGDTGWSSLCPICQAWEGNQCHTQDCALAALLAEEKRP